MSHIALILIDIQNDYFTGGKWPVDQMEAAAGQAARVLDHARTCGHEIFHVRHEMLADSAAFFRPGTSGADIHVSVAPQDGETVLLKHRPNAFHKTSLRRDLECAGITDVIVCGAMSQMCIDATVRAAVDFGYAVTVVEDACGAKKQVFKGQDVSAVQVHAAFMAALAQTYASVMSTDVYLRKVA